MPRHPDARYSTPEGHSAHHPFALYLERGWALHCECWPCEARRRIDGRDLVSRFGADCTLARLHPRLVCAACGARQVLAYVVSSLTVPGQVAPYPEPDRPSS